MWWRSVAGGVVHSHWSDGQSRIYRAWETDLEHCKGVKIVWRISRRCRRNREGSLLLPSGVRTGELIRSIRTRVIWWETAAEDILLS